MKIYQIIFRMSSFAILLSGPGIGLHKRCEQNKLASSIKQIIGKAGE